MPPDESACLFAVLGDKNDPRGHRGNDWYDRAIPMLDAAWSAFLDDSSR